MVRSFQKGFTKSNGNRILSGETDPESYMKCKTDKLVIVLLVSLTKFRLCGKQLMNITTYYKTDHKLKPSHLTTSGKLREN